MILVLALHRVANIDTRSLKENEGLKVTPVALEGFVRGARNGGWSFLSVADLEQRIAADSVAKGGNGIVITLDDGYSDNFSIGLPLFRRLEVPFCVFAIPDLLSGRQRMWWHELEFVLTRSAAKDCPVPEVERLNQNGAIKEAFHVFRNRLMFGNSVQREESREWLRKSALPWADELDRLAMSWEQLGLLANDSLATIGSHTMRHRCLASENETEVRRELIESKRELEFKLGRPVTSLAYPYGGEREASQREFRLAKEAGYGIAFTTRFGGLGKAFSKSAIHYVPRVPLLPTVPLALMPLALSVARFKRKVLGG